MNCRKFAITRFTMAAAVLAVAMLALTLCPATASAQLFSRPPAMQPPKALSDVAFDQYLGDTIPLETVFVDETGKEVRLVEYFNGKPVLLGLVYYRCPGLCIMIINGIIDSLREVSLVAGEDFEVVLISIDPKETPTLARDKKETILAALGKPEQAAGWHLLTSPDESQVKAVADAVGFRYAWDEPTQQYAHPSGIMILTPGGVLSRYFYGVKYPSRDVRLGLVESAEEKIGSPTDQILLRCFHYDPSTGRYTFAIAGVLRVAGLLTVLGLAGGIFMLVRYERGHRRALPDPASQAGAQASGPNKDEIA